MSELVQNFARPLIYVIIGVIKEVVTTKGHWIIRSRSENVLQRCARPLSFCCYGMIMEGVKVSQMTLLSGFYFLMSER